MTTTVQMLWQGEWGEYFGIIAADVNSGQAWDVLEFKGGVANNAGRINLASGAIRARQPRSTCRDSRASARTGRASGC
jgi:hypothetical protein